MLFNSVAYLVFFPIVVICYFIFPKKFRWLWLLAASYYFYMSWNRKYVGLMLLSTLITYLSGILLGKAEESDLSANKKLNKKRWIVAGSFIVNLGILFFFKYFNFASETLDQLFGAMSIQWSAPVINVLLPVGISFYTFQALSYTADVYYGRVKPEYHFGHYALFVSFFPQLVAGPIERTTRLLPQLKRDTVFDPNRIRSGLAMMWMGYFKKVVIADRAAVLVNTVYNDPTSYKGLSLVVATLFFSVQIYCDFSGYSDIAIGSAKILGYDLMVNFDRPYLSKSIAEFWRRWHISLGQWFRDCMYIPLGGNRVKRLRRYINIMIVFVTSGLWHGAAINFIIWGGLHGLFQIFGDFTSDIRRRFKEKFRINPRLLGIRSFLLSLWQVVFTYILTCFGWIFFRANSLTDALYIIKNLFNHNTVDNSLFDIGLNWKELSLSIMCITILLLIELLSIKRNVFETISKQILPIRWAIYIAAIMWIIIFGSYGVGYNTADFIYFQF